MDPAVWKIEEENIAVGYGACSFQLWNSHFVANVEWRSRILGRTEKDWHIDFFEGWEGEKVNVPEKRD